MSPGVQLTPEERAALVVRIDGAQTIVRIPRYKELLASARAKLAGHRCSICGAFFADRKMGINHESDHDR